VRETSESLIRHVVRHLKGTNRAVTTQTIYRRAALGLVQSSSRTRATGAAAADPAARCRWRVEIFATAAIS
jgi:hypothetical protein